jgi:glycine oxidase
VKVVVLGGGIIGCAAALELADRGAHAVLVERGEVGAEASSAAAGILGAQVEAEAPGPFFRTLIEARTLYRPWVQAIEERTGDDVGYRAKGAAKVALSDEDEKELRALVAWQREAGARAEWIDGATFRSIEPAVGPDVRGAAWFADDAQVDPPMLAAAVAKLLAPAGVEVREHAEATRLIVEGDHCVGIDTAHGRIDADAVVLSAGSWSSLLPGVPAVAPRVKPMRGQMIELRTGPKPLFEGILIGPAAYALPRSDGRIACGSTMEDVGHARGVTAEGLLHVLHGVIAFAPGLGPAQVLRTWSGFRPSSATGFPIVEQGPLRGLVLATGHHRNGILLARHTALRVADLVLGMR